jgi:hypothetical protein
MGQQTHKIAEYRKAIPEAKLESVNPQGGTCARRWIFQLSQIKKRKIRNEVPGSLARRLATGEGVGKS